MGRCACAHVRAPVRARKEVWEGTYEIGETTVMHAGEARGRSRWTEPGRAMHLAQACRCLWLTVHGTESAHSYHPHMC